MVLDDVLFEKMNFNQWDTVVKSKVAGCWNLHTALSGATLDFFIALSSVAGIIGNHGQAAYAAANTFLDSFVQFRHRQGLAATALDLAAVSDTGYLAENSERQKQVLDQIGGEAISEKEILALIAASITGKAHETCASQIVTGLKLPANFSNLFWASDERFAALRERAASENANGGLDNAAAVSPGAALKRATSYEEAHRIVIDALLDKTASVLMIPREELDPTKDTVFYGLDSLVSIEIRNWITREFGAALQILDLLSSGSFVALADIVLRKTELVSFEKQAGAVAAA
jgi:acyl carrier protein